MSQVNEYVACEDPRVRALGEAQAWLEPLGLCGLDAAFAQEGERRGAIKSLLRLPLPAAASGREGERIFVKRYRYSPWLVGLQGALKLNPARYSGPRELQNLRALARAGFRVPRPLAAGEGGLWQRRSFVALRELSGTSLDRLEPPADPQERAALLQAVAKLARGLHAAGFWHRDLYLCNLFWDPNLGLGLIDCERVGWSRRVRRRWRIKDLAALDYSCAWATPTERLCLLAEYLEAPPGSETLRRWARLVQRKSARLAQHGRKGP